MTNPNPNPPNTLTTTPATIPPDIYLGVVLELNKQKLSLAPTTPINKVREQGLELQLPEPFPLGTIGDNLRSLLVDLGVETESLQTFLNDDGTIQDEVRSLPFIGNIVALIFEADLTVQEFYLKIPPTPPPGSSSTTPAVPTEPNLYSVGISAVWDPDKGSGKIIGNLSIRGLYVKVSNLDVAKKVTPDEKKLPG